MKLKPCPFCGSKNIREFQSPDDMGFVECSKCRAATIGYVERAANIWNRRAKAAEPPATEKRSMGE